MSTPASWWLTGHRDFTGSLPGTAGGVLDPTTDEAEDETVDGASFSGSFDLKHIEKQRGENTKILSLVRKSKHTNTVAERHAPAFFF